MHNKRAEEMVNVGQNSQTSEVKTSFLLAKAFKRAETTVTE
jgi:hypothetical protein